MLRAAPDPARRNDIMKIITTREPLVVGPVLLSNVSWGTFVRYPIYIKNVDWYVRACAVLSGRILL